jgi:hypothetical protein
MNYKKRTSKRGTKSKEWYEEQIARIAPTIHYVVDDFEAMKLSYDIYNDDVSALTKEFNKWCDPLDSQLKQYTPVPYPVIHNKVNVLKGEMLKRQDEYSIISFSQKATQQKSKELKESVQRKVEQMMEDFQSKIQQGASEEEIQQMIEAERDRITPEDINLKNFKTEWEIFYEFALRYCLQTQHVKNKKVETLEDTQAANRLFVFSSWKHGKPFLEVRNPLYTQFHKSGNEGYVNKGEYIIYRRARTYSDVYEEHKSSLTTEELERLEGAASLRINKGHSVIGNKGSQAKYQFDTTETELSMALDGKRNVKSDKTLAEHQTSSTLNYNSYNTLIWETHYEFKGYENIYFLSYTDELGNKVTLPITKSFDIPKDADKYQKENRFGVKTTSFTWVEDEIQYDIEEVEIPIKYEAVLLDNDIMPIYRKVPNQVIDIEDPYGSFNLSTFGSILSSRNARGISPIQRVLPFYMQYLYIKHKQNKEIAKYKGYIQNIDVDQIPTQLGQDEEGNELNDPMKVWMTYLEEGKNFYSGTQTKNNMPVPPTRAPGSTAQVLGTAQEIFTLQNLLQLIDAEIGMAMGIPPQREAQFATNSNASDNRQALVQSYHITEPYMNEIDEVWRQATQDYIQNFRKWCEIKLEDNDMTVFNYTLVDGTEELFEVTPKMLSQEALGLFLKSNTNRREYNEYMLANAQAFAQNAENVEKISMLIKAITTGQSAEETHKLVEVARQQQERQVQKQEQEAHQRQMEMLEEQKTLSAQEHQQEMEKIELKARLEGQYDVEEAQIKAQTQIITSTDNTPSVT